MFASLLCCTCNCLPLWFFVNANFCEPKNKCNTYKKQQMDYNYSPVVESCSIEWSASIATQTHKQLLILLTCGGKLFTWVKFCNIETHIHEQLLLIDEEWLQLLTCGGKLFTWVKVLQHQKQKEARAAIKLKIKGKKLKEWCCRITKKIKKK